MEIKIRYSTSNVFTRSVFFFQCTWLDENCSASDFSPIFTSKGICFVFNKGKYHAVQ